MPKCVEVFVLLALIGLTIARTYNGYFEHRHGYDRHKFDHSFQYHAPGKWPPGPSNFHGHYHPKPDEIHYHRHLNPPDDEYWQNHFVKWIQDSWVFPDTNDRFPPPWISTTSSTTASPVSSTTTMPMAVQECIKSCRVTPEYNPVCGTDNVTYSNPGKLQCAKYCGHDVELQRFSPCKRPDSASQNSNNGNPTAATPAPNDALSTVSTAPPEEYPDIDIRIPETEP